MANNNNMGFSVSELEWILSKIKLLVKQDGKTIHEAIDRIRKEIADHDRNILKSRV